MDDRWRHQVPEPKVMIWELIRGAVTAGCDENWRLDHDTERAAVRLGRESVARVHRLTVVGAAHQ